jgi:hypothetical protein
MPGGTLGPNHHRGRALLVAGSGLACAALLIVVHRWWPGLVPPWLLMLPFMLPLFFTRRKDHHSTPVEGMETIWTIGAMWIIPFWAVEKELPIVLARCVALLSVATGLALWFWPPRYRPPKQYVPFTGRAPLYIGAGSLATAVLFLALFCSSKGDDARRLACGFAAFFGLCGVAFLARASRLRQQKADPSAL